MGPAGEDWSAGGSDVTALTPRPAPQGAVAPPTEEPPARARLVGVDVARALAIVGMFAVHVGPMDELSLAGRVYALPHGRASLLFVLVAGVGVSLLSRTPDRMPRARRTLWWRAGLLLPLGFALQQLDHGVNVILQVYAVLFVVGVVAVTWSDRILLAVIGLLTAVSVPVMWYGTWTQPERFARDPLTGSEGAVGIVDGLLLSGPYPTLTWTVPFLLGMWLGRRDLGSARSHRWLLGLGGASAAVGLVIHEVAERTLDGRAALLLDGSPHSQLPVWLLGGTGAAAFVLGASLWLGARVPRSLAPLPALGRLALTAYVLHLVVLAMAGDVLRPGTLGASAAVVAGASLVLMLGAWAWTAVSPRGPLERLLRLPRRLS